MSDNQFDIIVEGYETDQDLDAINEKLDELFEGSANSVAAVPSDSTE